MKVAMKVAVKVTMKVAVKVTMLNRFPRRVAAAIAPTLAALGIWGSAIAPARSQVLLPYTPQTDPVRLEEQGLMLADEAAQLAQLQQFELALPRAQVAVQLAPDSALVWRLLGGLQLQARNVDAGMVALERAQALAPDDPAVLLALGSGYFQQQRYDEAIAILKQALVLRPEDTAGLFDLGNAYLMQRNFDEAIANYRQAFSLNAQMWPALNNIGLAHYEAGDVGTAKQDWEAAIALDNSAAEPQLALAVALYTEANCTTNPGNTPCRDALRRGERALALDNRYGNLDFLKENLWGETLMRDTAQFFQHPQIQRLLPDESPV